MRIPPPNYTQTPNAFFDEIMINLTDGEVRVMLIIMRQTFGWHKDWDHITLNKMAEKTGYDRRSVARILKNLIEKNLVAKRKIGEKGAEKCYYSLVTEPVEKEVIDDDDGIETQEDEEQFQKVYTSDPTVTPPVTLRSLPTSDPTVTQQKKILTKEKQQQAGAAAPASASPPSPAVVVSSKEKNEFIHPKLAEVDDLTHEDRVYLSSYPEDRILAALAFAAVVPPKTTLAQELKWHCSAKVAPLPPANHSSKALHDKLLEMYPNGVDCEHVNINILEDRVTFDPYSSAPKEFKSGFVLLSDVDAKQKLNEAFKRFGAKKWQKR